MSKITIDRAVLEQAIDALERERPYLGPMPSKTSAAIDALRETLAHPQQEPVGEVTDALSGAFKCEFNGPLSVGTKLYTSPPARKPLTESEIYKAINDWVGDIDPEDEPSALDIFRAAEAAHGIKEKP